MKTLKIEGVVKITAQDGDEIELPFESDTITGAIGELGRIERHIEKKIEEAENRLEDNNE